MSHGVDITQLLLATQAAATLPAAEKELKRMEELNINAFLLALAEELKNETKPELPRVIAGNLLKSSLSSQYPLQQQLRAARWGSFTQDFRQQIKALSYDGMCSAVAQVAHSAARVISAIAVIELPFHYWDDLLPTLLQNMKTNNLLLKETTLRCLGYICQDLAPSVVKDYTNPILMTVMNGMKIQEGEEIVLAATTALYNCLQACQQNFAAENERLLLMNMIKTTCTCGVQRVRIKAMECLVEVASIYYRFLQPFMEWIFQVTTQCIAESSDEDAQKMAIEFWTTVAEREIAIREASEDMRDDLEGGNKTREQIEAEISQRYPDLHITDNAAPIIAPFLQQVLLKKDSSFVPEEWGVVMAACYLLSLFTKVLKNKAIDLLMPFVQANFTEKNPVQRDASVTCFGLVLDGPERAKVEPLIKAALVPLLKYMNEDPQQMVRDSASFTMLKVCECDALKARGDQVAFLLQTETLKLILEGIYVGLKAESYVSKNSCLMLEEICKLVKKKNVSTNALSPYFDNFYERLLSLTSRKDGDENDLRTTAIGTLTVLIESSADQHQQSLLGWLDKIVLQMQQINAAATAPQQPGAPPIVLSTEQKQETDQRLAEFLSIIGVTATRVGVSTSSKAQGILYMLFPMINTDDFNVHEEILQCLQKMAAGIGRLFFNYFKPFENYITAALKMFDQPQLIQNALNLLSDVVQGAEKYFAPSLQVFAPIILGLLKETNFPMQCRTDALTTLNDFALLTGEAFLPWLNDYMTVCNMIMIVKLDQGWGADEKEKVINMRNTMIEGIDCVLSGLHHDRKDVEFNRYMDVTYAWLINVVGEINSIQREKEQRKQQDPNWDDRTGPLTPTLNNDETVSRLVDLFMDISSYYGINTLRNGTMGILVEFLNHVMHNTHKNDKERKKALRDLLNQLK